MNIILIPALKVVFAALRLYWWALLIWWVLSLLVAFNVVNTYNQFVRTVGQALDQIIEPALKRIRRVVPMFGNLDISPIILGFAIYLAQEVIVQAINSLSR